MDFTIVEYIIKIVRMGIAASFLYWLLAIVTSPDFSKEDVVVVSILSAVIGSAATLLFSESGKK